MLYKKILALLLTASVLLCLTACLEEKQASDGPVFSSDYSENASEQTAEAGEEALKVHFLDVGQGDSVFLELPDETCMLIDASTAEYGDDIVETVGELGYERIDYVVATHPHADHIGGMRKVLNAFEIGCIYLPDASASTDTYIKLAETILDLEIEASVAETGAVILDSADIKAEFLAPSEIDESDQNKNSAVMLLTYGETKFLFMGDADTEIEDTLAQSVDCDVLKVGHHGSRTASGETFLANVTPVYAIISCGEGNSYGHPHTEALARLSASGATVLRTDLLGSVTVCSDGTEISVYYGSKESDEASNASDASDESSASAESACRQIWILNTSSKKIHESGCRHTSDIAEHNRLESDKKLDDLFAEGYSSCGTCKPEE